MTTHHELRYRTEPEPWTYSGRGAEIVRHEWTARMARDIGAGRILDVGCSQGQLTTRLAGVAEQLIAMDVSLTAVERTRRTLEGRAEDGPSGGAAVRLLCGSATHLPVASESVDIVVASDGIYSWDIPRPAREQALRELHRVVRDGGRVILTEHMRRSRFEEFVGEIAGSPLSIEKVSYLHDRPWYQLESWFKAIQSWPLVRRLRRSTTIARGVMWIGSLLGPVAARHVCVVAVRQREG